ncbi:hypothetical protein DKX38_000072 [Salix brachista]|uniref:Uncharacterized protein n=1 Tax=Salix brachista TaxID=2182728 RepID=A0A5N5P1A3_9ROSI|nr:hypothetical protein DKX38_000072 [Salix brachista]
MQREARGESCAGFQGLREARDERTQRERGERREATDESFAGFQGLREAKGTEGGERLQARDERTQRERGERRRALLGYASGKEK